MQRPSKSRRKNKLNINVLIAESERDIRKNGTLDGDKAYKLRKERIELVAALSAIHKSLSQARLKKFRPARDFFEELAAIHGIDLKHQ